MSPHSRSHSSTPPLRSYSRSPYRRNGRRRPPSPPPISEGRKSGRYSRHRSSSSRTISPASYRKPSNRRRYTISRSRTKSRSRSRTKSRSRSRSSYGKNVRNNREKPLPSRCIGIFGLSVYTTQVKIREIFAKFGLIERIHVVTDAQTGRSRGFCFIYYESLADAKAACDNCCGMTIDGRRIRVAYSITERPHTPTPGIYKGQPAKVLRERYRAEKRVHSPVSHSKSHRRNERSRSRSYSPRRRRY